MYSVTDEHDINRKERKEKTYKKIKQSHDAVLLKLCDRVSNVQCCINNNNTRLFKMYKKEYNRFKEELMKDVNVIWIDLDRLMEWEDK